MARDKAEKKAPKKAREEEAAADKNGDGKIKQVGGFFTKHINKGEMAIKRAIGLGAQPNVVPIAKPHFKDRARAVEVGWHPVGGAAGKWFAEDTGLGKMITSRISNYPDPTQHWAVLVGDYGHQLWMDENFHVIYINEKVNREEWQTFSVGKTRFNDDAIRRTGESVIQSIRESRPVYNLITNNCQTYALHLLDAIKADGGDEFGTTLAIYERLVGPGTVADLFGPSEHDNEPVEGPPPLPGRQNTVVMAQQVMDENTAQLDANEELEKQKKKKKKGLLGMFSSK